MTDWKLPWSAACMCGQVKMRISVPPLISMACHCRGCQRLTSGPYSLSLMIPADGFAVEGATEIGGLHKPDFQHFYCTHCKNWLFSRGERLPGAVNFRSTTLDDAAWVTPYVESNVNAKLPNVVSGATHAYPEFPPPADYPALIEGFAREGARPR